MAQVFTLNSPNRWGAHATIHALADSLPAERDARILRFRAPLDAYDTPRTVAHGYAVSYNTPDGGTRAIAIHWGSFDAVGERRLSDLHRSVFIIDDGASAVPHYVAGWSPESGCMYLHPYPTNPTGATRPDGRTIDYDGWFVSARTCYHLRVSAA